ncbi:MopE-related protein [Flavobacterium sp. 3HN19-14]|uniref:MopE-related protein n=1 Tax=Flavobacterium sp. 3HN19-14 TaxID=3448133 RepID=UPI003EE3C1F3
MGKHFIKDTASLNIDPAFSSATDLRPAIVAGNSTLAGGGANIQASVPSDIDCGSRSTTPSIGFKEFSVNICSGATAGTATPLVSVLCGSGSTTINATGYSSGINTTYQWQSSPDQNTWTSIGSATSLYASLSTGTITSTTYYRLEVICTSAPATDHSTVATVTVNTVPVVNVTPSSGAYCGSGSVNLVASGATTYVWSPATGLSATTGASVTATPSVTTTYTVVGTANGCSSVGTTVTITVNESPSTVTVTPASTTKCSADPAVLLTASGGSYTNTILSENFNTSAPTWTITNAGTSPAVSNWAYTNVPYTDTAGTATFSNFTTVNGGKFALSNADAGGSGSITNSVLTSPSFSTVGYTAANVSFEHAYKYWASGDTTVKLEISTDGGTNWVQLVDYKGTDRGNSTNNTQTTVPATVSLSAYLGQANLKIRYNYVSTWGYYWIVDDVKVTGTTTAPITWTPVAGLYTDAGATTAYTLNSPTTTVYAKPGTTATYTATATSPTTSCSNFGTATVTVDPASVGGAVAADQTICSGNTLSSDLTLSGNVGNVAKWQKSSNAAFTAPVDIANTTTTLTAAAIGTLTTDTLVQGSSTKRRMLCSQFICCTHYCKWHNCSGSVTGGSTICEGSTSGMLTLAGHTGTIVRWESAVAPFSTWNPIANTTNTYTSGALTLTTQFRAVVQSGSCPEAASSATTVTVDPATVAGSVTGGTTICEGATSGTLTLGAHTGTIVRWESAVAPFSTWNPIANTTSTYTSGNLTQTTQFRAVVQSGSCPEFASAATTVTVNPATVGGSVTGGTTICEGATSGTLTLAGHTGTIVRWESAVAPFSTWSPIANTTNTYTSGALTQTTQFRAIVQSGSCPEVASSATTVTVNPATASGSVTGGTTICEGSTSGTLTLAGHTGTIIRWESAVAPFSTWNPIANATATYTSGALTQTTQFRAVVQSGSCPEAASSATTVTVNPATVGGNVTGGTTICSGSASGTLTLAGHTGTIVRWESAVAPFSTWSPIANTASTYTSGALTQTTQFRVVVQSGVCAQAFSSATTVTVTASTTYYADADGDGFGNSAVSQQACSTPTGYVTNNTDCDDTNVNIYQSGSLYVDNDGDHYSNSSATVCYGATAPVGYSLTNLGTDCNDNDPTAHQLYTFYADTDGDGYGAGVTVPFCTANGTTPPAGYSVNATDCNDNNPNVNPGMPEIPGNGIDDNCNGTTDTDAVPCSAVTTWNGSAWSPFQPVATQGAVINGNYSSTGDLAACTLTVNSGTVVVNPGHDFTITNAVTVNGGSLTFENNANLIQVNDVDNTGLITVKRNATMRRLDYVYWGSPVAGAGFEIILSIHSVAYECARLSNADRSITFLHVE